MSDIIRDGTGAGYTAGVSSRNKLLTKAVTTPDQVDAINLGDGYNINTGVINLTDAVDTPVLYIKNNESTKSLVITAVAIGLAPSSNGDQTEMVQFTFVRNPTVGTIITSSPTDVDINSNRNYGSNNTLTVDAYKGATGDTMTDGEDHILVYANDGGRSFITITEVLPKGTSFGVKIKPQSSNTGMNVYCAAICHLEDA